MATTEPAVDHRLSRIPSAAFEIIGFLGVLAGAALAFVNGGLSLGGAAYVTVLLLATLVIWSWVHLGQGRHPCFLFLCVLALCQGGRLIAFCLGAEARPLHVELMGSDVFAISRDVEGLALLCVTLSAICIYAPCRWSYRQIAVPDAGQVRLFLPYLYLIFFASLPIQLLKNYQYYEYAKQHGGYLFLYYNRTALQASFPFVLRLLSQITLPAFVAIFAFEERRSWRYLVTLLYFSTAALILVLGQRSSFFLLAAALWYVSRIRSARRTRTYVLPVFAIAAVLIAGTVQFLRENPGEWSYGETLVSIPIEFVRLQGASLGVTEVAIQYRSHFEEAGASYLMHELRNAFVPSDARAYVRGNLMSMDVSAFLNPRTFGWGIGTGGSYLAEAYILGSVPAVLIVSLLIGNGLALLYRLSGHLKLLPLLALTLSDVIWLPRGELLNWVSALGRNLGIFLAIYMGWLLYHFIASTVRHDPQQNSAMSSNEIR